MPILFMKNSNNTQLFHICPITCTLFGYKSVPSLDLQSVLELEHLFFIFLVITYRSILYSKLISTKYHLIVSYLDMS